MNREQAIRAWVAALRSGKYQQCIARLYFGGDRKYCCLGVACEILAERAAPEFTYYHFRAEDSPLVMPESTMNALMEMNDIKGWSFDQIANYIEAELLPVAVKAEPVAAPEPLELVTVG